jgi:hypothetical protein
LLPVVVVVGLVAGGPAVFAHGDRLFLRSRLRGFPTGRGTFARIFKILKSNYKETSMQQATNLMAAISEQCRTDILFYGTKLLANEKKIKLLDIKPVVIDIASDGSHNHERGIITYGWVIAINEVNDRQREAILRKDTHLWLNLFALKPMVSRPQQLSSKSC